MMYYIYDDLLMSNEDRRFFKSEGKRLVRELVPGFMDCATHVEKDSTPDHYKSKDDSGITCDRAAKAMTGDKYVLSEGKPREGAKSIVMGCMDIYWRIAAFKYLWRFDRKNGKEDLDKAIDCIKRLKEGIYE